MRRMKQFIKPLLAVIIFGGLLYYWNRPTEEQTPPVEKTAYGNTQEECREKKELYGSRPDHELTEAQSKTVAGCMVKGWWE